MIACPGLIPKPCCCFIRKRPHMFCEESNTYLKKNDLSCDQEYIWLEQLIAQPFLHAIHEFIQIIEEP